MLSQNFSNSSALFVPLAEPVSRRKMPKAASTVGVTDNRLPSMRIQCLSSSSSQAYERASHLSRGQVSFVSKESLQLYGRQYHHSRIISGLVSVLSDVDPAETTMSIQMQTQPTQEGTLQFNPIATFQSIAHTTVFQAPMKANVVEIAINRFTVRTW